MGRRGPAPKPQAIEELQGNPRRQAKIEEIPYRKGAVVKPDWLNERAAALWDEVWPDLEAVGDEFCKPVDGQMLGAYCTEMARYIDAEETLEREGWSYVTDTGYVRPRPEVKVREDALKNAKDLAREFGFTPSARARINFSAVKRPEDFVDDLFGDYVV